MGELRQVWPESILQTDYGYSCQVKGVGALVNWKSGLVHLVPGWALEGRQDDLLLLAGFLRPVCHPWILCLAVDGGRIAMHAVFLLGTGDWHPDQGGQHRQ